MQPNLYPAPRGWLILLLLSAALMLASCEILSPDDDSGGGSGSSSSSSSGDSGSDGTPDLTCTSSPDDDLLSEQWHLQNTGQNGAVSGEDANVTPAWADCYDGREVRIAIVDDGLEIGHEDLSANVVEGASYNYVDDSDDPSTGAHGTSAGGVAAAVGNNGLGVAGAAPHAELVGYNVLQTNSNADIVDGLTQGAPDVAVSNNSWGPADGTGALSAIPSIVESALATGVTDGRDGLGVVYTWAGGNGGNNNDNVNYDGYASSPYVLAICAVGDDGERASYSERGASLTVCAPSEGNSGQAITTVDRSGTLGYNTGSSFSDYADGDYTNTFNGTSSAAPLAAGVAALVLQANPDLSWRDVRLILAQSARRNDSSDSEWEENGAGFFFNPNYGFGVVDGEAAVDLALDWSPVGTLVEHESSVSTVNTAIDDTDEIPVEDSITISSSGISSLEYVVVVFSASDHTYLGDLEVRLTNESTGTSVLLAEEHTCSSGCGDSYDGWAFGAMAFMGEAANGTWTLEVIDRYPTEDTGTFESWQLRMMGH